MEHKRRVERKHEEKEIAAKKERVKKAREAAQKARKVIECQSLHMNVIGVHSIMLPYFTLHFCIIQQKHY